jgi:parallel beta-helix repeat protein
LEPQTYVIAPSDGVQFELQSRLIEAVPGDVIQLEAGRYPLLRQLDVASDGVTIRGRGSDKTILTFKGQTSGGQGIEAAGDNFTLENLAVEDTAGNAVKALGARNVTVRDVRVEWTGDQTSANGAYGLYPVQCENVLLEKCVAIGASDAGL